MFLGALHSLTTSHEIAACWQARALAANLPVGMTRLNISLRLVRPVRHLELSKF